MTDHKHSFYIYSADQGAVCPCGAELTMDETECRINVCEELTAEDARYAVTLLADPDFAFYENVESDRVMAIRSKLRAYADKLSDK